MNGRTHVAPEPGLGRQLAWFFGGLLVVYQIGLAAFWLPKGEQPEDIIFLKIMFAPTVGALLARFVAKGSIQCRPLGWWLLPAGAVLGAHLLGSPLGWDTENPDVLHAALVGARAAIAPAAVSAVDEEIGWRGVSVPVWGPEHRVLPAQRDRHVRWFKKQKRTLPMAAASAAGLVKAFGSTRAVDGVDVSIPRGSFYGIAGPNGAGKTTMIKMLVGMLEPLEGNATVAPQWRPLAQILWEPIGQDYGIRRAIRDPADNRIRTQETPKDHSWQTLQTRGAKAPAPPSARR